MAVNATQVNVARQDDPNPDFSALLARVGRNDREAFAALFFHFGPRIRAQMLKSGAGASVADDVVQDVFLAIWRKASLYMPERGSVNSWIFTIARNVRIDRLRHQSSQPYEDIDELELISSETSAEQNVIAGQNARRVASAIQSLPAEQRQVIELAYMHDLPHREIAKRLALPLGTVKSRLRLAYGKLKQNLEEVGE